MALTPSLAQGPTAGREDAAKNQIRSRRTALTKRKTKKKHRKNKEKQAPALLGGDLARFSLVREIKPPSGGKNANNRARTRPRLRPCAAVGPELASASDVVDQSSA